VYLGAIVSVVVRVSGSMDRRRAEAALDFERVGNAVLAAGGIGFEDEPFMNDPRFHEAVQRAVDESRVLAAVILTGPGGTFGFERVEGEALIRERGETRFRSRFDFSWHDTDHLRVQEIWGVGIHGMAGVIDFDDLAFILRRAMILIAASLAVAFVTLLLESSVRRRRPAAGPVPAYARPVSGRTSAARAWEEAEGGRPDPAEGAIRGDCEARLAREMERCAAAGQDICFVAVEFKSGEAESVRTRIAADAARFFSSKELVFERGGRGLSVICPGQGLDVGFLNASEFHSRLIEKYPDAFARRTDLCMGISARSGREPMNAARLIFEAEEALERALMDPVSHIIAFRVDPEKYRAFMEGRK